MGRRASAALLVLALSSFPVRAAAATTVATIVGPDGAALEAAANVERIRFGEAQPIRLAVGDTLEVGDELRSAGGAFTVVLACSEAASVTLTGAFRVAIMPASDGRTCLLDLFAGDAYMTGDRSTGLGLGDVTAGAERTQYRAAVSRDAEGVRTELAVFDGEVAVRPAAAGGGSARALQAGAVLSMQGARRVETALTAPQLEAAARLYAVVDASRLAQGVRPTVVKQLETAYLSVLQRPGDADARLKLVEQQVRFAATGATSLHQLDRAVAVAPRSQELEVATLALSAAVYRQRGEETRAATREAALRDLGAPAVEQALRARKLDPKVVRRPAPPGGVLAVPGALATLQVHALAEPPAIHVLGETRIRVRVTTGDGAPVQGARVRIAAGGGSFGHAVPGAAGAAEAAGRTGANGIFVTVWGCRQCAPAYVLSVEATREGFAPARAEVTVRVE
ncbi:hypothetical protein [Anaeromyxobacter dehalogenans]|uniref:FecR protein domain-containing protein n=1 Tax=Anaeromyxobacter dehalogenans (strain 2CP-C) TaxID=290397 RepID=Q2IGE0_ANADE|nr:hypothetical protein [Anaeromyxobacter dehalogenans]ABC83649.1 conserved hypothetical protein [Anaeromyxobacter dehalogenans 2CP-C]